MATIDHKPIIDEIIAGNGYYATDPRVALVVEYTNASGRTTWGITYSTEQPHRQLRYLEETEFVQNPRIIWQAT